MRLVKEKLAHSEFEDLQQRWKSGQCFPEAFLAYTVLFMLCNISCISEVFGQSQVNGWIVFFLVSKCQQQQGQKTLW